VEGEEEEADQEEVEVVVEEVVVEDSAVLDRWPPPPTMMEATALVQSLEVTQRFRIQHLLLPLLKTFLEAQHSAKDLNVPLNNATPSAPVFPLPSLPSILQPQGVDLEQVVVVVVVVDQTALRHVPLLLHLVQNPVLLLLLPPLLPLLLLLLLFLLLLLREVEVFPSVPLHPPRLQQ